MRYLHPSFIEDRTGHGEVLYATVGFRAFRRAIVDIQVTKTGVDLDCIRTPDPDLEERYLACITASEHRILIKRISAAEAHEIVA